ncbi:acyl carrier protein [Salinispora oceanensis]|uniref:acyl carrier protein n=1 Tax=Salinispora oceanensis TaxID=1050199 RepID=UPI0003707E71|nr:acyl carrier protein [Salinispora oceanensis]
MHSLSLDGVRSIVAECLGLGEPQGLDVDAPIVVDSLAMVWIQHLLEERYGLKVDPERSDLRKLASVRAVHEYLAEKASSDTASL